MSARQSPGDGEPVGVLEIDGQAQLAAVDAEEVPGLAGQRGRIAAQRVDECGYGARLSTYEFTDDELHSAIDRLSDDTALAARLDAVSQRLQASPGRLRAADLIEQIARG